MSLLSMHDRIVAQAAAGKTPGRGALRQMDGRRRRLLRHARNCLSGRRWLAAGAAAVVDATHFVSGRDFLNTGIGHAPVFDGGPAPWCDAPAYNAALRQPGVIRLRA
jgi:hypothetical protein